ncbi:hypothetical protein QR680_008927 [Steinernema hermaphroditum]|uniref:TLC domain-containing protein n=1 Tax=Steinernema hermaphroditum TaxID=289476 RepID=A0AA39M7Y4_9BILA|nr:hypothetical protein QR680_008927 [Steinernema hermaphroditum]
MLPPEYNLTDPRIHRVSTTDYVTLVRLCYESIGHFLDRFYKVRPDYRFPGTFFDDLSNIEISRVDIFLVFGLAVFWTPIAEWWGIPMLHFHKFPECLWKFVYYALAWGFSFYVHILSGKYRTFYDPLSIWEAWASGEIPPVNWDIYVIYVTQCAFYIHSIYATLYMDIWRKDSMMMFFHHFIALSLIGLSYGSGHVLEGAFVLFLHDNTDLLLEMTKLCFYTKKRTNEEYYRVLDVLGNVFFVLFALMWLIFRLYWYPLKFLYTTVYAGVYLAPQDSPFLHVIGLMLVTLQLMNIYWFNFIVRMIVRVCRTGEDPEDNREFDTEAVSGIPREQLKQLAEQGQLHSVNGAKKEKAT